MKQIEYNLLEERWVRVRGQDYTVQEVLFIMKTYLT